MLNPVPKSYDYRPPTEPRLTVLHADADIVVLDKPSGLLTVPGKDPSLADSLDARVREKWPTAVVVHRLDKDTSGILLMALLLWWLAVAASRGGAQRSPSHG